MSLCFNNKTYFVARGSLIHIAVECENSALLQILLSARLDVNATSDGEPPALITACKPDNLARIQLSLTHGADVNVVDQTNPLHMASAKGHAKLVKFLVEHGAEKDKVVKD